MTQNRCPIAFISYCWKKKNPQHPELGYDERHLQRVKNLADPLLSNGVEVLLDQYELQPGEDTYHYMERVAAKEVDYVLLVCEKQFKEAFDARVRGVGTEATLMTPHLYSEMQRQGNKKKFIPLLFEEEPKDQLLSHRPHAVASKKYIDFTHNDAAGIEEVLRYIFDQPKAVKPTRGEPPTLN